MDIHDSQRFILIDIFQGPFCSDFKLTPHFLQTFRRKSHAVVKNHDRDQVIFLHNPDPQHTILPCFGQSMGQRIFHQRLDHEFDNDAFHTVFIHIIIYFKPVLKPHFQYLHIISDLFHLLPKCGDLIHLRIVSEHIAHAFAHLYDFLVHPFAGKADYGFHDIMHEMWIDLLLKSLDLRFFQKDLFGFHRLHQAFDLLHHFIEFPDQNADLIGYRRFKRYI